MYISYLVRLFVTCLVFVLSACVSIPASMQILHNQSGNEPQSVMASCVSITDRQIQMRQVKSAVELDAGKISLLNWNVYKGQRDNWPDDFKNLLADRDIVLLQEAVMSPAMQQMLHSEKLHWQLNTAFYYEDYETGVLNASKVQAIRSCGMRTPEPLIRVPKTMLVSEYPLKNRLVTLLVANIHGINFTTGTESYKQQLDALAAAIENHNGPVILAGDFNSWSDERMALVAEMSDDLFLQAVSYHNHQRSRIFGNVIDHVFYRDLEVVDNLTHEVDSSDHNPVTVVFRMPDQRMVELTNE